MPPVITLRHPSTRRWALWAFALALLLKAAMPMLASVSAQAQGVAVAEVCTVYGVTLVPLDGDAAGTSDAPANGDHFAAHTGDHCTLSALPLLAALDGPQVFVPPAARIAQPEPVAADPGAPHDASARWAVGLHHGPPAAA